MGQDRHPGRRSHRRLLVGEEPAQLCPGAEEAQDVGGDEGAGEPVGPVRPGEVHALAADDAEVVERAVSRAVLHQVGVGEQHPGRVAQLAPDRGEPVGVGIGQGAEEHRAHRAEDRGVGPDGEHQGEDGDRGERRRPAKVAEGEPDVMPQLGQVLGPAHVALVLQAQLPAARADLGQVAEAPQRLGPRIRLAPPPCDQLAGDHLEVEVQLLVHLVGHAPAPEHRLSPAAGWGRPPRRTRRSAGSRRRAVSGPWA